MKTAGIRLQKDGVPIFAGHSDVLHPCFVGFGNQVHLQVRLRDGTGQSSFLEDSSICISCLVNGGMGTLCTGLFWMGFSAHVRCCVRESVQVMRWCFLLKRLQPLDQIWLQHAPTFRCITWTRNGVSSLKQFI